MKLLKSVTGHRFAKQLSRIFVYIGLSRLITIAGTAWATRCLGKDSLGISTMIGATMMQIGLFVTCSLDNLFIRNYKNAASDQERNRWVEVAMSQRFFSSLILGVAAIPIAWLVLRWVNPPGNWWLGIWAALPLLILTSIQPTWLNIAQEDLPANFKAAAISSVFMAILFFLFFRHGQAAGSDLVVQVAQMALNFVILWWAASGRFWPVPIRWSAMREFWPVLREGRWLFVSGLIIYVYINLEVPMLRYFSNNGELGKYGAAVKLVTSAQQVLALVPMLMFPRFLEWRKQGVDVLWRKQLRLCMILLVLAAPACVAAFLLSPFVFRLLYGAEFQDAAIPFAILFTSKIVVVFNGIFSQGLWAQAEDRKVFWVLVPTAIVSFLCNLIFLPQFGMFAACCVNLLSELLVLGGCFILARRHLHETLAKAASLAAAPTPI